MEPIGARLRPGLAVFALDGNRIQIGLADPVILDGLTADEASFVASLEGPRTPTARRASDFSHVLGDLAVRGLLLVPDSGVHVEVRTAARAVRVAVVGASPLGVAVGLCLAQSGVDHVLFDDPTPVPVDQASRAGAYASRAQAAAHTVNHWPTAVGRATSEPAAQAGANVTVVVASGAVDTALIHDLMAADQPHLPVLTDELGITVGPLVVPGRGPCLTCLGIERASREPHWPRVALQCNGSRAAYAPAPLGTVAAGVASHIVSRFVEAGEYTPTQWRIVTAEFGPHVVQQSVTRHPACACCGPLVLGDKLQNLQAVLL